MREGRRDLVVAVTLVVVASAGVAYALLVDPAPAPPSRPSEVRFIARAVFCPPELAASPARTELAVGSSGAVAVPVEIEPDNERKSLRAGRFLRPRPTEGAGTSITGYGARLQAGVYGELPGAKGGAAAAPCSETASSRWYFAEGSSELGDDQRLVLFNPFLDEAVMRVLFHTDKGVLAKAALSDVDVPPGRAIELKTNDYVLREKLLATSVLVTRGKVVAWREQQSDRRGSPGVELSLGAEGPRTEWYFPYGSLSRDAVESIAVLNPTTEESVVTVTLASEKRVQQPPRLVEQTIPPQSALRLSLDERVARPRNDTEMSAWVSAVNGIPVVAERRVVGSGKRSGEVTSEVGSAESATRWWLAPVVGRAVEDRIELMNPGASDARVAVTILRRDAPPLRPRALAAIDVPAGLRTSVDITRWTKGEALSVALEADGSVVAERWGRQRQPPDAAAAMGVPVRPNGPR